MRLAGAEEGKIDAYRREAREKGHACHGQVFAEGAELIVIGKHAAGVIEHAFVGSGALQVLEMAACDVLIVPGS